MEIRQVIESGRTVLGIELGSTRIKAVLIDENHAPIASGSHEWENQLVDGIWTYSLEDAWKGLQDCYRDLKRDVAEKYGAKLTRFAAIGMSAMMHGYLPFDKEGRQLAGFRTWRNTITGQAAGELTKLFGFNIPQRWSIAHLYQAILNGEEHVKDIAYLTTLAGYMHWKLTGRKAMGVGEASGMFPIDSETGDFDARRIEAFDRLVADKGFPWKVRNILPEVLSAGEDAGCLTEEGAKLLDPSGELEAGIPMCPPEGDAGTGMVATNSVAVRTGNVSAGTSVFAMVVLERALKRVHEEIDMVTTPAGRPVAMVHCNNCTTDLNAWVSIFGEFAKEIGAQVDVGTLFGTLYRKALEGDKDCGDVVAFNFYSGEHIVGFSEGRPLLVRKPESKFTLANFMRAHLYAAVSVIKIGMEILIDEEKVKIDNIYGHGGFFKTKGVGQSILAAAIDAPVSVMETAGEGGAWGVALLAKYMVAREGNELLEDYLNNKVFAGKLGEKLEPNPEDVKGFNAFIQNYKAALAVERAAIENIR
ncbi:MAG TPA: FGGY-family carbohydrate kinase [Candidatus Pullichristensenella excrementigallinarum]|uniref:FGGY-family carbohydrate kinase n=1 Tax=Candidatus Pullichristensenella excrementigallinarum TaxID=2840907 RepID=A0A9D1IBX0_9FIRM|nr:FGGY-family carbohydrate kinase [Candidatus Pullichristensenella excrementigallinarum]